VCRARSMQRGKLPANPSHLWHPVFCIAMGACIYKPYPRRRHTLSCPVVLFFDILLIRSFSFGLVICVIASFKTALVGTKWASGIGVAQANITLTIGSKDRTPSRSSGLTEVHRHFSWKPYFPLCIRFLCKVIDCDQSHVITIVIGPSYYC
jgi:hypothetical protein